ncbi:MAG: YggS family pyridoxal phosphate-dependent enzyme [Planctomycetes bacterium]|nr:YggS family pyridoxal phosphate-dependent enzyme [Planctomycetota bacterium]MCP4772431.1 YggS family pyridoxal phosphate-dependent enzyme [Planctomycetota bacterium]MCP4860176.1 YggS family pyridoxal phosphate-dependent enzyme [Planctomycetota bacterium]
MTAERLAEIRRRIDQAAEKAARSGEEVQLVAVAKTATPETLREAWQAGQRLFGHNRVQALEEHRAVLPQAEWHLLGPLQGKKVRRGLAASNLFQALGESRTLGRMERVLDEQDAAPYPVLLQVNLHPEDGRYGSTLENLDALVDEVLASQRLHCAGLMTLALANVADSELRSIFASLHRRFQDLQSEGRLAPNALLSMGMSADFETAIEEGANLVRVGRAIFPSPTAD